ncbi:helix-turn-helix transcriptional regulator [Streptomyces peucetius]|uniref:DNA-binding response regulator n=1 Tax=Streptomyces peucetius TaxID=1950 RepID=A0ABY6IGJ9_STRPE|nr:DNA-binding response regulator [Streptomyces peucetius]UYQ64810.1 DNA-binding response regulator [Streptomyces peucetius]
MDTVVDPPDADGAERTVPEEHAAHLEQTLLQAQALIESTMSLYRRQPVTSLVAEPTDVAVLGSALDQLIGGVRHSLSVALTLAGDFTDGVLRLLARVEPSAAVRVLCSAEVADVSLAALRRLPQSRLEIRVVERELREIVVVDGVGALVRGISTEQGTQATVVNDAAAVRALELMFAGTWSRGRRLADHLELGPRLRTELARDILERLRTGHTDDVAARELNVSLRTYRRHVAEIMRELDANSRFQAGARAVELGLLTE